MTTPRSDDRLVIPLAQFPRDQEPRSIYRRGDERLALRPDAMASLTGDNNLWEYLVLSGCWRSLAGSRRAVLAFRAGRKKLRPATPGESLHLYGLSIDVNTAATCKRLSCTPAAFRRMMGGAGWWWYGRTDEPHYTFVAEEEDNPILRYRDGQFMLDDLWPDRRLLDTPPGFAPGPGLPALARLQRLLAHAGHDPGDDDGDLGSRTRAALAAFREATLLPASAPLPRTWRAILAATAIIERVETRK